MKKLTNKDLANLLKKDVKSFNSYREKYPNQKIDFTQIDDPKKFKYSSLDGANLSNMNLEGLNFADSNMGKVQLIESNIMNCNFSRCYLNKSDLRGVLAVNTRFELAEAEHCDFRGADVDGSKFDNSILHDSDFRGSNLTRNQISKAQCHKKSGWSDGSPDYLQTIKTDPDEEKSDGVMDIFFVVAILVIFLLIFLVLALSHRFGSII